MTGSSEFKARREGENAALALRHRLNLGAEGADLDDIASELGVLVVRHPFGDSSPDGMYAFDGETAVITVNSSKPAQKSRFTLAHELGHHELHRFRGAVHLVDLDVFNLEAEDGTKDLDEVAANSFAAHLLVPAGGLEVALAGTRNAKVTADHVVALVRRYRVSWETVCNRLRNEEFIRKGDRERLLALPRTATLAANGIDASHFHGGPDLPASLVQGAAALWAEWVISDERLAQILELEIGDALELMRDWGIEQRDRAGDAAEAGAAQLAAAGIDLQDVLADLDVDDDDGDE